MAYIIKQKKVSKDLGRLGRFYGVSELQKRRYMKETKEGYILTKKGKKELQKKEKEYPFVSK